MRTKFFLEFTLSMLEDKINDFLLEKNIKLVQSITWNIYNNGEHEAPYYIACLLFSK